MSLWSWAFNPRIVSRQVWPVVPARRSFIDKGMIFTILMIVGILYAISHLPAWLEDRLSHQGSPGQYTPAKPGWVDGYFFLP